MSRLSKYKEQNLLYWTKWEKRFYDNYLLNSWLKKIRRQSILWQRICDFIITRHWVRVEIDWKHHDTSWYKAYDKKRDRILFERYWLITLRIKDFDDKKAIESIDYIRRIKRDHTKRLQFIKKNIRDKEKEDIDREKYSDEWKLVIDYYFSLYKQETVKTGESTPIREKKTGQKIKKEVIEPPRSYSVWISMLYNSL